MPLLAAKILVGFVVGVLIGMTGVGGGVLLLRPDDRGDRPFR